MQQLPSIHPHIGHIAKNFRGILLDAYGVFWGGNDVGLFPGTLEAMEKLVSSGKVVGILSNTTAMAAKEVHKLKAYGMEEQKHFHFFITSGDVARSIFSLEQLPFQTTKKKFWIFGGGHPKYATHGAIFEGTAFEETTSLQEADFVYIAIPHIDGEDQTDPLVFHDKLLKIKDYHLPMVCPNPDLFAHEGNPSVAVVRQGSIAELYKKLGGTVFYIGKPHTPAYLIAMESFQKLDIRDPREVLMIGDTPETDIRGARNFGMGSALITETGIMADRIQEQGLEECLSQLSDMPDYYLGRFIHGI